MTFEKPLYVDSVEITDKIDCCPRDIGIINVTISTSPAGLDPTCVESMEYGGKTQDYKFHFSPPARGSFVTVERLSWTLRGRTSNGKRQK